MTTDDFSRRQFLRRSASGLAGLALGLRARRSLEASPLGLPIGLELYTVRNECDKDLEGTLKQVAAAGYKEVEMYSFYGRKASEIRRMLDANGLVCPSAHYETPAIRSRWEREIEFGKELGLQYMICAFLHPDERKSLDDYRRLAGLFNRTGEQCRKAGLQFAYHNHNFEFREFGGVVAYDELLKSTDAAAVQLELDCYWLTRAGRNPQDYFHKYPGRFPLLHIKDRKSGYAPSTVMDEGPGPFTEVGRGSIDWAAIFRAAPKGGVKHYFVEQDFCDRSPLESIRISFDYLNNLKV